LAALPPLHAITASGVARCGSERPDNFVNGVSVRSHDCEYGFRPDSDNPPETSLAMWVADVSRSPSESDDVRWVRPTAKDATRLASQVVVAGLAQLQFELGKRDGDAAGVPFQQVYVVGEGLRHGRGQVGANRFIGVTVRETASGGDVGRRALGRSAC
jgi:hypothetical protein